MEKIRLIVWVLLLAASSLCAQNNEEIARKKLNLPSLNSIADPFDAELPSYVEVPTWGLQMSFGKQLRRDVYDFDCYFLELSWAGGLGPKLYESSNSNSEIFLRITHYQLNKVAFEDVEIWNAMRFSMAVVGWRLKKQQLFGLPRLTGSAEVAINAFLGIDPYQDELWREREAAYVKDPVSLGLGLSYIARHNMTINLRSLVYTSHIIGETWVTSGGLRDNFSSKKIPLGIELGFTYRFEHTWHREVPGNKEIRAKIFFEAQLYVGMAGPYLVRPFF